MIQVFDGFDHYNDATDLTSRRGFLQYQQGAGLPPTVSFITGRNGFGKAMQLQGQFTDTSCVFGQRVSSAFVGFAMNLQYASDGVRFQFIDSLTGDVNVEVFFNYLNYAVQVYRGSSTSGGVLLGASANNQWSGNTWNFIEIWPVIASGTGGSVEVRVNSETVLSLTGVDTNFTGANAWWDVMAIQGDQPGSSGGFEAWFDDLYYGDTTVGPGLHACDVPIGDARVATVFPVGNNSVQWTPLANANWQEVSEVVMDSDTSYNYTTTAGDEDLLNFGSMENTIVTIYGVQVTGAYRKDDGGARVIKQGVKSGSTETYGANWSLPDTLYSYFTDQWVLDPNTGLNWTISGVNALSAGYNLVS